MPSKSQAQANLMRAAEHGAQFPLARKLRASMTRAQLREFTTTKSKSLPRHVKKSRAVAPTPSSHGGNRYAQRWQRGR